MTEISRRRFILSGLVALVAVTPLRALAKSDWNILAESDTLGIRPVKYRYTKGSNLAVCRVPAKRGKGRSRGKGRGRGRSNWFKTMRGRQ